MTFLELRTGAELGAVRVLNDLLAVAMRALGVEEATLHDLTLGVAELVTNVCEHESPDAQADVAVRLDSLPNALRVTVTSQGPPFDLHAAMAAAENADPLSNLEGRGLGLPILAALFDAIEHEHEQGHGNRITLVKNR